MAERPIYVRKTARAFAAYLTLLDTGDWMRSYMRRPLAKFGLTMEQFRLLAIVLHAGRIHMMEAARIRSVARQNLQATIRSLEAAGLLRRENAELPPAPMRPSRLSKARRDVPRRGRQVRMLSLTAAGENLIGDVLPKHAKVVKALMRALDGREQETLARLCAKLRLGDPLKFIMEMRSNDAG